MDLTRMICAESVRGFSHSRVGKPCEDSFKFQTLPDDITLMALADGHGSESCPFSKTGSRIAVNVFCSLMENLLHNFADNPELLVTYLNREGEIKVAQAIEEEWKRRIWRAHLDHKRERAEDADGKIDKKSVYHMYGTTLLGLLVTPAFLFAFQLGDGDILYVDSDGVQSIVEADKILGTETHSLSSDKAWKKAISTVRRLDENDRASWLYLMSSDGFANSYPSTQAFEQTCLEYYETIQEHGFDAVASNLKDWLRETSALGCGDDITVMLNYNQT